jgi:anti-sigma factor RsiW
MTHDEASELLAALALDAVDDAEREAIEEHLVQCPHCQSELDALREVAGVLGNSVEPLPEKLWTRIASGIYDHRDVTPPLAALTGERLGAPITHRRRSLARRVTRSVALPLAVVVAILSFQLANADHRASQLQHALASDHGEVVAALATPGHQLVNLTSSTHQRLVQFVLVPDGRGYLVNSQLPTLAPSQTYQLWDVIGKKAVSIGLMGPSPRHVTFTLAGTTGASELAITVEPSGGTITPSTSITASGAV